MTPPDDKPATDSDPPETDQSATPEDEQPPETETPVDDSSTAPSDHPKDAIEPPTETPHQPPAAAAPGLQSRQRVSKPHEQPDVEHEHSDVDSVESPLDGTAVDSKWWYAVAAVPLYVLVGIVGGVFAVVLFLLGVAVDVGGGMGLATGLVVVLLTLGVSGYALAGLALSILFPVGIYLDAKAVTTAETSWKPDAVLYLLVAAASVVLSAFTLSAVVALYYLYRRNQAVGVP